jgi:hypothetical protein
MTSPLMATFLVANNARVSDIIGKRGYNKILDALDDRDIAKLETLHSFIEWALECLQEENN